MAKYWYATVTEECPVCGNGRTEKYRMYTPKPDNIQERYEYIQTYDYCNER